MKKIELLFCVAVLAVVANARAETIFETFDSDPLGHGWTKQEQSEGTYFQYNDTSRLEGRTSGFLEAVTHRDDQNLDRYTTAITSLDETAEFWMEMDIVHLPCGLYQAANFGVFDSSETNNHTDTIQDRHNYQNYTSWRANRHDLYGYSSDGTKNSDLSPYIHSDPDIAQHCEEGDPQRIKMHYWYDSGSSEGYASLDVYQLLSDGSLGQFLYGNQSTGLVIGAGGLLSVDLFGLGNRTDGSYSSSIENINEYDNLYFSTDGPNLNPQPADFIPEPTSIALLSLGGFFALRRKRK